MELDKVAGAGSSDPSIQTARWLM